jgi:hypothetical protein
MNDSMAHRIRSVLIKECNISKKDIWVGISTQHTGFGTVIINKEAINNVVLDCIKNKVDGLSIHESNDKKCLIIDEP